MYVLNDLPYVLEVESNFFDLDSFSNKYQNYLGILKNLSKECGLVHTTISELSRSFKETFERSLNEIYKLRDFGFLETITREKYQLLKENFSDYLPLKNAKEILLFITNHPDYIIDFEKQKKSLKLNNEEFDDAWEILLDSIKIKTHTDEYINEMNYLKYIIIKKNKIINTIICSHDFVFEHYKKRNNLQSVEEIIKNKKNLYYEEFSEDFGYNKCFDYGFELSRAIDQIADEYKTLLQCQERILYLEKFCFKEVPLIDRYLKKRTAGSIRKSGVYLCTALIDGSKRLYKVGYTKNLKDRLVSLKTEYDVPIQVIHFIDTYRYKILEGKLHGIFKEKNVEVEKKAPNSYSREWFELSNEDINFILNSTQDTLLN